MPRPTTEANATAGELEYAAQLLAHLPSGEAWARGRDTNLWRLARGTAVELARVHGRALDLYREGDPRTSTELLPDWEEAMGLPDECTGALVDVVLRRGAVVAKLLEQGGQSPAYFVALADRLGFSVSVVEHHPFLAGSSTAGDALTNDGDPFMAGHEHAGDPLGLVLGWSFYWDVVTTDFTVQHFVAGSTAGEPLATWSNDLLECVLSRAAPAHTIPRFLYVPVEPEPPATPEAMLLELEDDDEMMLTADFDYSGGDWASNGPDSTWHEFSSCRVPFPMLLNLGTLMWEVSAVYIKSGGGANTLTWELLVDGVPTGAQLAFASSTLVGYPGMILLSAWLRVIGDATGGVLFDLEGHQRIRNEAGVTIQDLWATARPVIDPMVDHVLALRLKQTGIAGDAFFGQNVTARWLMKRKGG